MAEQFLNCAYVIAILQQVGGKTVAKRMATTMLRDS